MTPLVIKTCPTCGAKAVHKVRRDIESRRGGELFVAKAIDIEECSACGEQLFGPDAMAAISAQRRMKGASPRRRKAG